MLNLKRIGAITTCASCKSIQQRYVGEADRSVAHAIPWKSKNASAVRSFMRVHNSFFFFFLLSRATTRNDLLARNNRLFDTAPSSVRLKEERCTGNLTSSLSLSPSLVFYSFPTYGWIKGESHRYVPLRLPRCLLRMFSPDISRSPPRGVPGMSRIVSLLSWHIPTLSSLRHTLTHLHTVLSFLPVLFSRYSVC